jgi:hypothetical protein
MAMGRKRKQVDLEEAIEDSKLKGHNQPDLTDDEKRALLLQHKRHYQEALADKKAADATLKNVCKKAKAECGKDAVADIKDAILMEEPNGRAAIEAEIERKHRIARWMGLPVGAAPSMFEDTDRRPAVDIAYDNGKGAGMAGAVAQPPYDPSVPQYQRWMEGWHDGQEILASAFGKLGPKDVPGETPNTSDTSDPPFIPPAEAPAAHA